MKILNKKENTGGEPRWKTVRFMKRKQKIIFEISTKV